MNSYFSSKVFTCIVIDDDPSFLKVMELCLSKIPCLSILGFYTNPIDALEAFREAGQIDFLFIDVRMPISGLDFAARIREQVNFLVFLSAYPEHALDAFSVSADHYLLKPVTFEAIERAVDRILKNAGYSCQES